MICFIIWFVIIVAALFTFFVGGIVGWFCYGKIMEKIQPSKYKRGLA